MLRTMRKSLLELEMLKLASRVKVQQNISDAIDKERIIKWASIWVDGFTRKIFLSMLSMMMTSSYFVKPLVGLVPSGNHLRNICCERRCCCKRWKELGT
jgi:hypothetical protein